MLLVKKYFWQYQANSTVYAVELQGERLHTEKVLQCILHQWNIFHFQITFRVFFFSKQSFLILQLFLYLFI